MSNTAIVLPKAFTYYAGTSFDIAPQIQGLRALDGTTIRTWDANTLTLRMSFDAFEGILQGTQRITVRGTKESGSGTMMMRIIENGTVIKEVLLTDGDTSTDPLRTITFEPSELADPTGVALEYEVNATGVVTVKNGTPTTYGWALNQVYWEATTGASTTVAPETPTNLLPVTGASTANQTPTFSATLTDYETTTSDLVRLVVDVSQNSNFTSYTRMTSLSVASGGTATVSPASRMANGTWYWRAKAMDAGNLESPYTATQTLIVNNRNPDIPSNLSPANNTVLSTGTLTISATLSDAEGDPLTMTYQVSKALDFSSLLYTGDIALATVTIQGLAQGNYYWRVRAKDTVSGQVSGWTTTRGVFVNIPMVGRYAPDAILLQSGFSNNPTTAMLSDDPDTPDGNWAITTAQSNSSMRVAFPNPPAGGVKLGSALQNFRVLLRTSDSIASGARATIRLYDTGVLVASSSEFTPANATGLVFELAWNGAQLTNQTGDGVECEVVITGSSAGKNRGTLDIGAIEWNYQLNSEAQVPAPEVNYPVPTIGSISSTRVSDETGKDTCTLKFSFNSDVAEWRVSILGASWDTGTIADSFVGLVAAGTECTALIDWTELRQEGENRVNIYGKSQASGAWTPYNI